MKDMYSSRGGLTTPSSAGGGKSPPPRSRTCSSPTMASWTRWWWECPMSSGASDWWPWSWPTPAATTPTPRSSAIWCAPVSVRPRRPRSSSSGPSCHGPTPASSFAEPWSPVSLTTDERLGGRCCSDDLVDHGDGDLRARAGGLFDLFPQLLRRLLLEHVEEVVVPHFE